MVDGIDGTLVVLVGKLDQIEKRRVALPVEVFDFIVACARTHATANVVALSETKQSYAGITHESGTTRERPW